MKNANFILLLFVLILSNSVSSAIASSLEEQGTAYGYASWYGSKFHGRTTANGEKYDMYKMTAAHKSLPFGTLVRVTNTKNNKSVVVRINDRGPFIKGRIIDMSKKGAFALGFMDEGIGYVKLSVLGNKDKLQKSNIQTSTVSTVYEYKNDDDIDIRLSENDIKRHSTVQKTMAENALPAESNIRVKKNKAETSLFIVAVKEKVKKTNIDLFKLQFGAYTNLKSAITQQKLLSNKGFKTHIVLINEQDTVFRLLTKKTYNNYKIAERLQKEIAARGVNSVILFL